MWLCDGNSREDSLLHVCEVEDGVWAGVHVDRYAEAEDGGRRSVE